MITGIGVDIIEIDRIRRSVERFGDRLLHRMFTTGEIEYCRGKFNMYQHLAARFAAKEAFSKAIATGLRGAFGWNDIEVVNDPLGKPELVLHGQLKSRLSGYSLLLSISHSESHVVSVVVIEKNG